MEAIDQTEDKKSRRIAPAFLKELLLLL